MNNVEDSWNTDPYWRSLKKWQELKRLRGDSLRTGRISSEGGLGNWTCLQNVILECLPLALRHSSSAATWKMLFYFTREILGRTRNGSGRPKTCINYKANIIRKKALIDGSASFYIAKATLEDKNIIYFKEDRVYFNLVPLTWNIENQDDKSEIEKIVKLEIDRIDYKIEKESR